VKGECHNQLFVLRDLLDGAEFTLDEAAAADLRDDLGGVRLEAEEGSSTIALRTQATGGNPSSILCHVLPSSLEPNSFPLRVPK